MNPPDKITAYRRTCFASCIWSSHNWLIKCVALNAIASRNELTADRLRSPIGWRCEGEFVKSFKAISSHARLCFHNATVWAQTEVAKLDCLSWLIIWLQLSLLKGCRTLQYKRSQFGTVVSFWIAIIELLTHRTHIAFIEISLLFE